MKIFEGEVIVMEIEIEKKAIINKSQYDSILEKYSQYAKKHILQINYYYDTHEKKLYHSGETLRIRQTGKGLTLQHKTHNTQYKSTRISEEFTLKLKYMPEFISINNQKMFCIGQMITYRIEVEFDDYTVFLDTNMYLGKIDYEIEIEASSIEKIPQSFEDVLFSNHNCKGKYKRFIYELEHRREDGIKLYEKNRTTL